MAFEEIIRLLGGHDLKFASDRWSISLSNEFEDDMVKSERELTLTGNFRNWGVWNKAASVHLKANNFDTLNRDGMGKPICGAVFWEGAVETSFDNGEVAIRCLVIPEILDNAIALLRTGSLFEARFTLDDRPPVEWDGKVPLLIRAVHLFAPA